MNVISILAHPFNLGIILDGLAYSIIKVCMCSVGAEGDDIMWETIYLIANDRSLSVNLGMLKQ